MEIGPRDASVLDEELALGLLKRPLATAREALVEHPFGRSLDWVSSIVPADSHRACVFSPSGTRPSAMATNGGNINCSVLLQLQEPLTSAATRPGTIAARISETSGLSPAGVMAAGSEHPTTSPADSRTIRHVEPCFDM